MQTQFDAVVVGGGVVGNACALGLAQTGVQVAHISIDAPVPSPTSDRLDTRIYAISNSNVELFKRLRVWDSLDKSRMCAVSDMSISGDSTTLNSFEKGQLRFNANSADMTELAWIIEQSNMQHSLQMALRFVPNLTTFHTHASTLTVHEDSVQVGTSQGDNLTASLLIGADGANSWTRQAHGIGSTFFDYEQYGVVANFGCTQPHFNCAYQWFFANGDVLALLPLPNQHVSMVYSCSETISQKIVALDADALVAHISELSQHTLGALTALQSAPHPPFTFPLKRTLAKNFIAPHTLLIGDAAHTVHPLSGQGLNLGLQDLDTWLHILNKREPHRTINDPVLLRRYERARIAPTLEMQGVTHALNRLFQNPHPIARHARNVGMNLLDLLPPIKRHLIQTAMGSSPKSTL